MSWFDTLLRPIMIAVAWIMVGVHDMLTAIGLASASGVTWTLSIVALVIVIRILLIPLFVRQIRAARAMQMLSPELQAVQKKYKGRSDPASREAMTRETMELYRKHGTNPFSSCLPLLAQSPIFFALFRVLSSLDEVAAGKVSAIGPMTREVAGEAENAEVFGAAISSWFFQEGASTQVKIVSVVLIATMSLTTFTTQKQLTQKNMPASAMQGPMAQQQKMLLYLLPVIFAISGVNFPIGVLIYWTTTNLWSMGQQFYVIRRNPTPGSEAERRLKERRARKAAAKGLPMPDEGPAEPEKPRGQRQQPVRKERARPTNPKPGAGKPGAGKPGAGKPGAGGAGKPGAGKPGAGGAGKPGAGGAGRPGAGSKPGGAGSGGSTETSRPARPSGADRPQDGQTRRSDGSAGPTGGKKRRRPAGPGAPPDGGPSETRRPQRAEGTGTGPEQSGAAESADQDEA